MKSSTELNFNMLRVITLCYSAMSLGHPRDRKRAESDRSHRGGGVGRTKYGLSLGTKAAIPTVERLPWLWNTMKATYDQGTLYRKKSPVVHMRQQLPRVLSTRLVASGHLEPAKISTAKNDLYSHVTDSRRLGKLLSCVPYMLGVKHCILYNTFILKWKLDYNYSTAQLFTYDIDRKACTPFR